MEISDTDILSYESIEVDMSLMNATKVIMTRNGFPFKVIRVVSMAAGLTLISQIEDYRKELEDEAKRLSAGNS